MNPKRKESEVFDYLCTHAYSDAFSDIMDEMGLREQVILPSAGIRPMMVDSVLMGRARTLLNDYDQNTDDPYKLAIECVDSMVENDIVVASGQTPLEVGIMGELTATAVRSRGGRGAFINGYSRDVRKILKMDFPLFAKGASPIDTTGRVRVVAIDIPVVIGGQEINPGDLVFADMDGAVILPRAHEVEIIDRVMERIGTEDIVRDELGNGTRMREVWNKYQVL